jgi:hypothetical protein
MSAGEWLLTFQTNIAPSLLFTILGLNDPEEEGRMLLKNVRYYFPVNMM